MADLSEFLMPTRPIDVETRKKVFFSISRQGVRQVSVKSGGIRFYELNFQRRPLAEYEDLRDQWGMHYPGTVFQWSNTPLNTAGEDYYFDNDLTYTVSHPNNLEYKVNVRRKTKVGVSTPANNIIPYQPNFTEEVDELIRARIDDSSSYVRASVAIASKTKTYKLKFMDRTMNELLEMENFWAYHYPTRQIVFNDLVLELNGQLFYIDSDFKWQIERENSINYSFLIVEVPSDITPYTLVSRSGFDTLSLKDSIVIGLSNLTLSIGDEFLGITDTLLFGGISGQKVITDTLSTMTDQVSLRKSLLLNNSDSINNFQDAFSQDLQTAVNLPESLSDTMQNLSDAVVIDLGEPGSPDLSSRLFSFEFDGRGSVLDSGTVPEAILPFSPVSGTITEIYIKDLDDVSGSGTFDVRAAPRSSSPPGAGQSLVGSGTAPSISGSESTQTDLSDWDSDHFDFNDEVRVVLVSNLNHKHMVVTFTVIPD